MTLKKSKSKIKEVVFIKPNDSSFIKTDQVILEHYFKVKPFLLKQMKSKLHYGWKNIELFFLLISKLFSGKVIFVSWFADYHAAIMVLASIITRKKSVIFIGGQEAICYPELNKGVYRKKIRGLFVKFALKYSDLVITNHPSLLYHENYYYNSEKPHIDGIKHYVKRFNTPVELVYNGVNMSKFKRNPSVAKQQDLILTVGTMTQFGDFYNKGFDLFIETAQRNPQLKFCLIGLNSQYMPWVEDNYHCSQIPQLIIIPFCPQDDLIDYYNKAKVFVQASITEGMPNTLTEAMLMECIPVGSNVNGIPDVIGNTGVIIDQRKVEKLEEGILRALKLETSAQAKDRVIDMFSLEKRKKRIYEIFDLL